MPNKTYQKRYTQRAAQALLARLVSFGEGPRCESINSNTRRLLLELLQSGPYVVVSDARHEILGSAPNEIAAWSAEDAASFQNTLAMFVRGLMPDDGGIVPSISVERVEFGAATAGTSVVTTIDGAARDLLRFQLVQLVQTAGVDRLRTCECGRIFAKTGRRAFCSDRCQKRIYMRGKRQEERLELERRQHGKATRTRRR